jgi:hypothetical protein
MLDHGRTERELVCVLTDEEVQSRARMLAETVTVIDEVQTASQGIPQDRPADQQAEEKRAAEDDLPSEE